MTACGGPGVGKFPSGLAWRQAVSRGRVEQGRPHAVQGLCPREAQADPDLGPRCARKAKES